MDQFRLDPSLTRVHPSAFVAPGVVIVGDVHVGAQSSVWFGTVIRGDVAEIRIGERTNVQDGSVVHADEGIPCTIGNGVTIGHKCIIHGATVEDGSLVGMGAIVMNNAVIGAESVIGAGALVTQGKVIPPRSLCVGSPARVVRSLNDAEIGDLRASARHYVAAGQAYKRDQES